MLKRKVIFDQRGLWITLSFILLIGCSSQQLNTPSEDHNPSRQLSSVKPTQSLPYGAESSLEHISQLVFAGGGGRGFAYFPTLKFAIKDYGLRLENIEAAAGTSAGAIGALMSLITDDIDVLEEIYRDIPTKDFRDFSWSNVLFFSSEMGIYEGDELRNWLVSNVYRYTGLIDPTFEELHDFNGKTLKIFATNLTQGTLVEFSHIKSPGESVIRSILISSALPIAFKPKKSQQGDILVDGGLIKNHPIDAFDFVDIDGTRYANPSTLGFYAQSSGEPDLNDSPDKGVMSYLQSIFDTVTHHESRTLSRADLNRTIMISCPKELTLTTLNLKEEQLESILESCDKSIKEFIIRYPHRGHYPTLWAVQRGYNTVLDSLYQSGNFVENLDKQGNSPLMIAVLNQRRDIVKQLINYNCNLCHRNHQGLSALELSKQLDLRTITANLHRALCLEFQQAIDMRDFDRAFEIIDAGVDISYREEGYRSSLLDDIVASSDRQTLEALKERGYEISLDWHLVKIVALEADISMKVYIVDLYIRWVVLRAFKWFLTTVPNFIFSPHVWS